MLPFQVIQKKRDNNELSKAEIEYFVNGLIADAQGNKAFSDSQIGAFLMACYLNGLSDFETAILTEAMAFSGEKLKYAANGKPIADKHSTGGVGDKISLILSPICMAAGIAMPMISGRGLGHTGGTLDKLESIEGFNINLNQEQIDKCMNELGGFIIGQSAKIAPADKILYSIRDVTATVDNIGLIVASILSKKIAESLEFLVMDIKMGAGAFLTNIEDARKMSQLMNTVGKKLGVDISCVITKMDNPIGKCIGNWLEIVECEEFLKGEFDKDLKEITYKLCSEIFVKCKISNFEAEAFMQIDKLIDSGKALECFYELIRLQGGDLELSKMKYACAAPIIINSQGEGYVKSIDALALGKLGIEIGAGRAKETDVIDYIAGFKLLKSIGDKIAKNEALIEVYGEKAKLIPELEYRINNCFILDSKMNNIESRIMEVIG
jgi:pyrimidine-nucleoside phosphorylase